MNQRKRPVGVHRCGAEFVTEVLSAEAFRDYKQPSIVG